jgi:hypothetical protein
MVARYFFDALDMSYEGGLLLRGLEKRKAVLEDPETLQKAFDFGISVVSQ